MKVRLSYFKPSGKWYTDSEYDTEQDALYAIWDEVATLSRHGALPGLVSGSSEFIISVDVPEHPHNHPHLILPEQNK